MSNMFDIVSIVAYITRHHGNAAVFGMSWLKTVWLARAKRVLDFCGWLSTGQTILVESAAWSGGPAITLPGWDTLLLIVAPMAAGMLLPIGRLAAARVRRRMPSHPLL
jgi:hypothetical protein